MWSFEETGIKEKLKKIQNIWKIIANEALAVIESKEGGFTKYWEETDSGNWDYFSLFFEGKKKEENCRKMPQTCSAIEEIPEVTIDFGQVMLRFVYVSLSTARSNENRTFTK